MIDASATKSPKKDREEMGNDDSSWREDELGNAKKCYQEAEAVAVDPGLGERRHQSSGRQSPTSVEAVNEHEKALPQRQ